MKIQVSDCSDNSLKEQGYFILSSFFLSFLSSFCRFLALENGRPQGVNMRKVDKNIDGGARD